MYNSLTKTLWIEAPRQSALSFGAKIPTQVAIAPPRFNPKEIF
jgi:hypothetical protein